MKSLAAILIILAFGHLARADGELKTICRATDPDTGKSVAGKVYFKRTQFRLVVSLGGDKMCDGRAQLTTFSNPNHGASYTVKVYKTEGGDCSLEVSSIPVEGEDNSTYGHGVYSFEGSPRVVTVSCQTK